MRPRTISILAGNAKEARTKAAIQLGTPPENILVESGEHGRFEARLINCDAELEITTSEDNMVATITRALPACGNGASIDATSLTEALENHGVRIAPLQEAARKVLDALSSGQEIANVVIARGIPPEPAQDARIEPLGNWKYPVFPNDPIGNLIPATNAKPGKSLSSTRVNAPGGERGRGLNLLEGGGCFIDQTAFLVRSERFGLAHVQQQDVWIDSAQLLKVSKSLMRVTAVIYPKDYRGNRFTLDRMRSALETEGITGAIDSPSLITAIELATGTQEPVKDVVICRGLEPKDGKDGWFEMLIKDERSQVGELDDTGRMDYRSRGMVRAVKRGEILGRLHEPEPGVPGRDVYGKIIPAREGRPFGIQIGENIETSDDERQFTATDDGMVLFVSNRLSVTDVFQTRGDVNMGTGNICIEKGSVHVRGSILAGFSVQCPGNILVDEVVENATVTSGGDIEIRGGILMDTSGGKITAEGGISALYAKNATIVANGDVNIAHELSNCIVFAGRQVIAVKGRGKIIGSTVRAGKGVEAKEIGSDLGVETTIFLGIERRSFSEELQKKRELQAVLQKIYGTLGSGDPKDLLARARPEKRQAVASLLKARLRAEKLIKEIESSFDDERERIRRAVQARVKVHKTIHPGTIINCFGVTLNVSEPLHHSQIYYDSSEQKIVVASL